MGSALRAAVELSQMGEQYMLARYLSNNIQHTDRVPMWSVEDVCQWLQQTGFPELCQAFRQVGVDGDLLLPLREKEMTEDLEMTNGIVRRRFLRELRNLKRMSDYTCVDAEEIAEFLSGIQPDFREYTYNLYKADMTVESMVKLCYEDLTEMLTEAGVENKVHQPGEEGHQRLPLRPGVQEERQDHPGQPTLRPGPAQGQPGLHEAQPQRARQQDPGRDRDGPGGRGEHHPCDGPRVPVAGQGRHARGREGRSLLQLGQMGSRVSRCLHHKTGQVHQRRRQPAEDRLSIPLQILSQIQTVFWQIDTLGNVEEILSNSIQ